MTDATVASAGWVPLATLLYSSERAPSAFETAAAAAASSAFRLTTGRADSSRVHVSLTGPSLDAVAPDLHNTRSDV